MKKFKISGVSYSKVVQKLRKIEAVPQILLTKPLTQTNGAIVVQSGCSKETEKMTNEKYSSASSEFAIQVLENAEKQIDACGNCFEVPVKLETKEKFALKVIDRYLNNYFNMVMPANEGEQFYITQYESFTEDVKQLVKQEIKKLHFKR